MQTFKKLIESIQSTNPGLISEQAANSMLKQFNEGIEKVKADALKQGQELGESKGFRAGYEEGKSVAEKQAKEILESTIKSLDEEATAKMKTVLQTVDQNNANKLLKLQKMFKDKYVLKEEVQKMDADCAAKFEKAINVVKAKDKQILEASRKFLKRRQALVNEDHTKKLINIANNFKKKIGVISEEVSKAKKDLANEKAKKLDIMCESVEKYLNYALSKSIPQKQIISEQKYRAMEKSIEKITSILKINNIIQESKDSIFQDYQNKIKAEKDNANKYLLENVNLKHKLEKQEAKILLEEKLQKSVPAEANFLRAYFKNAQSPKVIEEQIEDAKSVFKRLHNEKRQQLVQKATPKTVAKPTSVVSEEKKPVVKEEPKKVVTEGVKNTTQTKKQVQPSANYYDTYMAMLKQK